MNIADVLLRDPATHPLVNQGQARLTDHDEERALEELRGELASFVCEGQYAEGIQKIIRSFIDNLGRTNQRCAWVSGFFGSGKSHLLKMLGHLWVNTEFPDGDTARNLVPAMPQELEDLFRELDTNGRRAGGLVAATGTLPSGTTENVRATVLGILLRATGLPAQHPPAKFCLWLHSEGHFDAVKASVEAAGMTFERELNNLYVSGPIARAVIDCDSEFADDEAQARQLIRSQFPPLSSDIGTEEFLLTAKESLGRIGREGRLPCTLIVLDEVQQYVGDSNDRSVYVTELADAVAKQLDSRVMIVGAGQSALTEMPLLGKMLDRFTIRISLSDTDVETVTRKVLLQKKPSAVSDVHRLIETHSGEISRQLQDTRLGRAAEDSAAIVDDYPLLPVRWRFWKECFRQIDAAGTHSQLRSQLRIIHDALAKLSDRTLGGVVPGDELYDALAPEMVNTGVLLREINERIIAVGDRHGALGQRVCGVVFLIGKLVRDAGADTGVRATKDHIADLVVDDLTADNGKLRSDVDATLKALADDGTLMKVGDEFRLQTREGSEWDQDFRNFQTQLNNDAANLQFKRDQQLYGEIDRIVRSTRVVQGKAKEPRACQISREDSPPAGDGPGIPVWIRDGWASAERDIVDAARAAGTSSALISMFIPRRSADDLRRLIVEAEAAQQALDKRGNPSGPEGQEARQSMESRRNRAVAERDRLIAEVVANAKVFQGGGSEIMLASLEDRIRQAADDALVRLFPRFGEADSAAWGAAIRRAREGTDQPFQPIGYTDATERHPVCQEVMSTIGTGSSGRDIRKILGEAPFGWPRDAVDAALTALHRSQHINATLNRAAVSPGRLDQNRISKAEFCVEIATLGVKDRIALRKLYQTLGVNCKAGDEGIEASGFLSRMIDAAKDAGGEPPLPGPPSVTEIEDIQRLTGNEQLVAIKDKAKDWEEKIESWKAASRLAADRLPKWQRIERLARHAAALDEAKPLLEEMESLCSGRLLLDDSDPASALQKALADTLRTTVRRRLNDHRAAFNEATETLGSSDVWARIDASEQTTIRRRVGLAASDTPDVSTDEALADRLDRVPLDAMQAEIDAVPGRVAQAIERAAKSLQPEVQPVSLERATLRDKAEVDNWIERQRQRLHDAVADGPVLVQ